MSKETQVKREKEVPAYKLKLVKNLVEEIKNNQTILLASTKKLPSSQFHEIKKKLRGKAEIRVAKKSIVLKAIEASKNEGLQQLKEKIVADVALFFSNLDAFELSGLLGDNQSPAKAKTGDIPTEDIHVEPGPTELLPGPAISELSGVGLKVAVENGKLAIKLPATVARAGEPIKENVASVLSKLGIFPMKVGFEPLMAYDLKENKLFLSVKIDKKGTYEELKDSIKRALGFALNVNYPTKETISFFIGKAGREEKAIENLLNTQTSTKEGQ